MTEINVTVSDPGDENERAILEAAAKIVDGAQDDINLEGIFTIANKVGAYLLVWRNMMVTGMGKTEAGDGDGYTEGWVEDAAMVLFHKFFHPWEPEEPSQVMYSIGDDDD